MPRYKIDTWTLDKIKNKDDTIEAKVKATSLRSEQILVEIKWQEKKASKGLETKTWKKILLRSLSHVWYIDTQQYTVML
jgi:hypothetical protein